MRKKNKNETTLSYAGEDGGLKRCEKKISETKKIVNRPACVYRQVNWSRDHLNVD